MAELAIRDQPPSSFQKPRPMSTPAALAAGVPIGDLVVGVHLDPETRQVSESYAS